VRKVFEFGKARYEREPYCPDRTVSLLCHDQFRFYDVQRFRRVTFYVPLAVKEHHHVRILFDTPRFADIGQQRPLAFFLA